MKVIELALSAGKRRQSEVTGFVHLCYENREKNWETIPVYENFCFALALLRSRTAENILKSRALIERLLPFEVGGEFPLYLHEFPQARVGAKLYPVIFFILRDFHGVIGDILRAALTRLLKGFSLQEDRVPQSAAEWGRFLVWAEVESSDVTPAFAQWDSTCCTYTGPQQQERGEPALTLYDLFMGEWGGKFSARALVDHPVHLQASLIFPCPTELKFKSFEQSLVCHYWGDGHPTHSLLFRTSGSYVEEEKRIVVTLAEKEVEEEMEIEFFCDLHPETKILVKGQKATTFQLGDLVTLISKNHRIDCIFRLQSGEGKFWGHLLRGNRPGQLERGYEAYDHVIGLRTVERTGACIITVDMVVTNS